MSAPLIAIIGDTTAGRQFDPPMPDPAKASQFAEALGAELARRGARLQVYGGPYLEAEVVRGFVRADPANDRSILKWYSQGHQPPPFNEEKTHEKLFTTRIDRGTDWEIAFYRSIAQADGMILIGGGSAAKISGLVAIGERMPILCFQAFGGGAAKVWESLTAGEDLPTRDEINLMAGSHQPDSAKACVDSLFAQIARRQVVDGPPRPILSILGGVLFLVALSFVPLVWGSNAFAVWMLFFAPLVAGGAGGLVRPMLERLKGSDGPWQYVLATVVLGLVAGGIAGILVVTAQLTGDPQLAEDPVKVLAYAKRSIITVVAVGFIAGLTANAVLGKLLGEDVVNTSGIKVKPKG